LQAGSVSAFYGIAKYKNLPWLEEYNLIFRTANPKNKYATNLPELLPKVAVVSHASAHLGLLFIPVLG
jgi:hypothetical protein